MAQRPRSLRVKVLGQIGRVIFEDLLGLETVEAQEPVGLVEPMLAAQGRARQAGQARIGATGTKAE